MDFTTTYKAMMKKAAEGVVESNRTSPISPAELAEARKRKGLSPRPTPKLVEQSYSEWQRNQGNPQPAAPKTKQPAVPPRDQKDGTLPGMLDTMPEKAPAESWRKMVEDDRLQKVRQMMQSDWSALGAVGQPRGESAFARIGSDIKHNYRELLSQPEYQRRALGHLASLSNPLKPMAALGTAAYRRLTRPRYNLVAEGVAGTPATGATPPAEAE